MSRTHAIGGALALCTMTLLLTLNGWGGIVSENNPPLIASLQSGLDDIKANTDLPNNTRDIRESAGDTIRFVVTFVSLAALVAIITAGIFLMVGFGSDTSISRAKKIVIFTVIGLFVIFFARVIVAFFTVELPT